MATRKSKIPPSPPAQDALAAIRDAKNDIVAALIAEAKGGSYQHAKFLFEFAGISDAGPDEDDVTEESLAEFFVKQLRLADPDDPVAMQKSINEAAGR
ncbi:MAG: hypothetical protein ACR2IF_00650 [Terriglobales bacterium]